MKNEDTLQQDSLIDFERCNTCGTLVDINDIVWLSEIDLQYVEMFI